MKIGLFLFIVGIILALISATKLPAPHTIWSLHAIWSDLLDFYALGIFLALGGLWWWRRVPVVEKDSQTLNKGHSLLTLLPQLHQAVQKLEKQLPYLNETEITRRIEELLNTFVLPLVTGREEVIYLLGRDVGVKVLLAIAEGERLLNRMWSAINDGYIGEVHATCPRVVVAFEEAYQQIKLVEEN